MTIPVSGAVPGFDRVKASVMVEPMLVLGKVKVVGVRTACGAAGAVPVPVTAKVAVVLGPPPELDIEDVMLPV